MLKIFVSLIVLIFVSQVQAFESGVYYGENEDSNCSIDVAQEVSSVDILSYGCIDMSGVYVGWDDPINYEFGITKKVFTDVNGQPSTLTINSSKDLLGIDITPNGSSVSSWNESFINLGENKIKYLLYVVNAEGQAQKIFDVVLEKEL